jgi:hypothetical protein
MAKYKIVGMPKFPGGGEVELDGYRYKQDTSGKWFFTSGAPVTDPLILQRLQYEAKPVGTPAPSPYAKPDIRTGNMKVTAASRVAPYRENAIVLENSLAQKQAEDQRAVYEQQRAAEEKRKLDQEQAFALANPNAVLSETLGNVAAKTTPQTKEQWQNFEGAKQEYYDKRNFLADNALNENYDAIAYEVASDIQKKNPKLTFEEALAKAKEDTEALKKKAVNTYVTQDPDVLDRVATERGFYAKQKAGNTTMQQLNPNDPNHISFADPGTVEGYLTRAKDAVLNPLDATQYFMTGEDMPYNYSEYEKMKQATGYEDAADKNAVLGAIDFASWFHPVGLYGQGMKMIEPTTESIGKVVENPTWENVGTAAWDVGMAALTFAGSKSPLKFLAEEAQATKNAQAWGDFMNKPTGPNPSNSGTGLLPVASLEAAPSVLPSMPVTNIIEASQNLPKVNSELFNLNTIRKPSGSIGNQGATPEGARNILNSIGINVESVTPGQPTLTEMVNHLKNNPQDAAKYQEFLQNEPIELYELPGGEYHLKDGHHRATLAYYSGNESIPAIINNKGEYTGAGMVQSNIVEATKEPWRMKPMSGLHLKSTMTDGPISKIVESKTGLINTEQALGIIAKESGGAEKVAMIKQALGDSVPKKIDYNDFRKLVQDQLIPLEKQLVNHASTFGLSRIGHSPMDSQVKSYGLGDSDDAKIIENQTILFSNKSKFGIGSDAHSNPEETLGHAHFFRDSESPDALTITQLQSDAFQGPYRVMPKKGLDSEELDKELFKSRRMEEIQNRNKFILDKMKNERVDFNGNPVEDYQIKQFEEIVNSQEESNLLRKAHIEGFNQKSLLDKNHQERYIQEIVSYAAERGDINRLRLPTSETAARIQGYRKTLPVDNQMDQDRIDMELDHIFRTYGPESQELRDFYEYQEALKREVLKNTKNENIKPDYSSEHKTILKKYAEQPKLIKKLYGVEPKIVTDGKGNTWYEFNIPYEFREGPAEIKAFRHGGSTSKLSKFIG